MEDQPTREKQNLQETLLKKFARIKPVRFQIEVPVYSEVDLDIILEENRKLFE